MDAPEGQDVPVRPCDWEHLQALPAVQLCAGRGDECRSVQGAGGGGVTTRSGWKSYERRCAAALGGRRIPVTGIDRHGADVETPMFDVQIKLRKALPAWIFDWLDGICGTAQTHGKIGLLILKTPRMRDSDALVVLRMSDWIALHGTNGLHESAVISGKITGVREC